MDDYGKYGYISAPISVCGVELVDDEPMDGKGGYVGSENVSSSDSASGQRLKLREDTQVAMYPDVVAGETDPTIRTQVAVASASQVSPPLASSGVKVQQLTNAQHYLQNDRYVSQVGSTRFYHPLRRSATDFAQAPTDPPTSQGSIFKTGTAMSDWSENLMEELDCEGTGERYESFVADAKQRRQERRERSIGKERRSWALAKLEGHKRAVDDRSWRKECEEREEREREQEM